ncbi:hypothetical protein [uncultured Sphingomonas sp.]|uniref:hypothetical protein n=1 Tax=uncultured Sphingomonas sp. TaxID=158754 RepID=UPI0025D389F3|nr:hypothetical protein [uncultured Sphingomonas sp.]
MTTTAHDRLGRRLRIAAWTGAVALLALPFVAMQFTREVNWTAADFVVFGGMLLVASLAFDRLTRLAVGWPYRIGAAIGVFAGFFLVWVNLAVGIVGSEDNPANQLYALVIAAAVGGTFVSHARAKGMARTFALAAGIQAAIGVLALAMDWGEGSRIYPRDIVGATLVVTTLWLAAAGAFAIAARNGD